MGSPWRAVIFLAPTLAAGCLLTTSLTGLSDGVTVDAGAADDRAAPIDAAADRSPPPELDGGGDAPADAPAKCCGCVTDPMTSVTLGNWLVSGTTTGKATFVELTTETFSQAAGIFWPTPAPLGAFDVSFEASITTSRPSGNPPADGLAFVALDTKTVPSACLLGSNMCVLGQANGFGLAIRIYREGDEPVAPYLAAIGTDRPFDSDAGPDLLSPGVPLVAGQAWEEVPSTTTDEPPNESWHSFTVSVAAGSMSVTMDRVPMLTAKVPATTGLWGFVAGTGGYVARQAIRNVAMNNHALACE